MRLIDAHKLQKAIYEHNTVRSITKDKVVEMIKEQPTVDPVKHGRWIFEPKDAIEMMFTLPKCSLCGSESSDGGKYCTNCGARMDGESNEID